MKFCQVDGTELVADEPAFDPYATVVGHRLGLTPETEKPAGEEVVIPPIEETPAVPAAESAEEKRIHETTGSIPIAPPDDVLELPGADPLKTMYVSESELKEAFRSEESKDAVTEESIDTGPRPSGSGGMLPPPSPFSAPEDAFIQPSHPSPYADADAETVLAQNAAPPFKEAETVRWTPPPVEDTSWQNQQVAANAPFQPVKGGVDGESKGLAVGSLVTGILSLLCCFSVITGPAAVVMGFIAKKKADENPSEFGGRGLALGGMITGALGFVLGVVLIILQVFFGLLGGLMGNSPS